MKVNTTYMHTCIYSTKCACVVHHVVVLNINQKNYILCLLVRGMHKTIFRFLFCFVFLNNSLRIRIKMPLHSSLTLKLCIRQFRWKGTATNTTEQQ